MIPTISDTAILSARPPKNPLDVRRPYAFFAERECAADGSIAEFSTLFLTNRECPFRCLMCDLWKNTIDEPTPAGALPEQIDFALERLPPARGVKLYNSGNFFDSKAVPPRDLPAIAARVRHFERVVVENHPQLCGPDSLHFRDLVGTRLELALGLETIHPEVLPALNKRMTVGDFDRAARLLVNAEIDVRVFVLLRPPFLSEEQGIKWGVLSVAHAFEVGAGCCVLIPVRGGNGIMEQLAGQGQFAPPSLDALEEAFERSLALRGGRVFADLWDIEKLARCPRCAQARIERLSQMNLTQRPLPPVTCDCRVRP